MHEFYTTLQLTADGDAYLGDTRKGEEAGRALTVRYRNQLSVCVHWMQGTHGAQGQDFLCASRALDGQLHLHIRQACGGDKCVHTHARAHLGSSGNVGG